MTQDIQIMGEPVTDAMCKFVVDRPVYADASFYFGNPARAEGSPLAEKIFALPGVISVLVSHNVVTVTKGSPDPWPVLGKQIGAAIREHINSGQPAVSASLRAQLPPAEEIRQKVENVLESEINPAVASHGGTVQLIDVRENDVYIQMGGGCQGCGMATATLRQGVEVAIRNAAPEVGAILDVTDHAAGRNPFYSQA